MELEELKSKWKKYNIQPHDKNNFIIIPQKSWIQRNIIAVEGVLSIIVAVFLIFMLIVQKTDVVDTKNLIIYICWFIISIYTLVKGIYTIFFFINMSKLDMESSKFLRNSLKNQLYFVYEKLTWLWLLIPLIIITIPFFIAKFITTPQGTLFVYSLIVSILYLITLLVFSKILWQKKQEIISEMKKIELSE